MSFDGTTFLITGGSLGIGKELAKELLTRGARVLVCGRHGHRLEDLRKEAPGVQTMVCDVTDQASVEALRDEAARLFGAPDVVMNNAAIFQRYEVLDETLPVEHWIAEIQINVIGTMRVTHAMLPLLRKSARAGSPGTIVNFTSPAAYIPLAAAPSYSASKAAILSWTQSLAHQLRGTGISAIQVNPPAVDTRMNANNPDVEHLKLWSVEDFTESVLVSLSKSRKDDILVGDAKLVRTMRRLAPGMVFNKMNPKRSSPTSAAGASPSSRV